MKCNDDTVAWSLPVPYKAYGIVVQEKLLDPTIDKDEMIYVYLDGTGDPVYV